MQQLEQKQHKGMTYLESLSKRFFPVDKFWVNQSLSI